MLERSAVKVARSVLRRGCRSNSVLLFDIKSYKKVRTLYSSMNPNEISRTLDMSESLVKEYIAIHEEFNNKEEKINDGSNQE